MPVLALAYGYALNRLTLTGPEFEFSLTNMKKRSTTRRYRMSARAEAAARTGENIIRAAGELWREHGLDEITLQAIADRAGVTVQTVIRRFGSKKGVVAACIAGDVLGIRHDRDRVPPGDIGTALDSLIRHYERDGDAVLRTLGLEDRLEDAREVARSGRVTHRQWCARVFAPYLPPATSNHYEVRLNAFVAATDLYLWKLFRRDLGRSVEETRRTFRVLLEGLTALDSEE